MSGESWETTSGLLDDYVLTFEEVWFAKPKNYQDGKATVLQVRGTATDPEDDGEILDDEKENFYSLGDGWEPDDGGEAAAHGAGKTKFNENSSMGKLIKAAVGLGEDVIDVLKSRGESTDASTWRGLIFRMERTEFTFKDRKTGEERNYYVDLPIEFLGVDEDVEGQNKKASGRKAAAKKDAPAAKTRTRTKKAEVEAEDEDGDAEEAAPAPRSRRRSKSSSNDALKAAVIEFAAEFDDHSDFMEAVLDADEFAQADDVQADEELLNDIIDEDGAIWAASREVE